MIKKEKIPKKQNKVIPEDAISRYNAKIPQQITSFVENSNDYLIILDKKWRYIYANKKARKLIHAKKQNQIIGVSLWKIFPELIGTIIEKKFREAIRTQKIVEFYSFYERANKWYANVAYPGPLGLTVSFRDVTQKMNMAETLREREEYLNRVINSAPIILWAVDKKGVFKMSEGKSLASLRLKPGQVVGKFYKEVLKAAPNAIKQIDKAMKGESIIQEGTYQGLSFETQYNPLKDALGNIVGVVGVSLEITERKRMEEIIKQSERQYQLVFEHVTDLITVLDTKGTYLFTSPSHKQILGYTSEELAGTNAFSLIHPQDREYSVAEFLRALKGKTGHAVFRFKHKNGNWLTLESAGAAIFDKTGKPFMVVITTHDITQRIYLDKKKDDFMSMASHELKTPLTSMKVYSQLLLKNKLDNKSFYYVNRMHDQINRLTHLVEDLLDIAKIQTGKLDLRIETFSLSEAIEETIGTIQAMTQQHKIVFIKKQTQSIRADKERIIQVLINLLINAIKFSPNANKIIVSLSFPKEYAKVSITDFGKGIPKEHLDKVFDRFYRILDDHNYTYPGLGMGLYISKEIISRHNGNIAVRSTIGKRTTFSFTLPLNSIS